MLSFTFILFFSVKWMIRVGDTKNSGKVDLCLVGKLLEWFQRALNWYLVCEIIAVLCWSLSFQTLNQSGRRRFHFLFCFKCYPILDHFDLLYKQYKFYRQQSTTAWNNKMIYKKVNHQERNLTSFVYDKNMNPLRL